VTSVSIVYKVNRLTRSLADFAKLVERFDAAGASFVSETGTVSRTARASSWLSREADQRVRRKL